MGVLDGVDMAGATSFKIGYLKVASYVRCIQCEFH
jgi:hypothetical protein